MLELNITVLKEFKIHFLSDETIKKRIYFGRLSVGSNGKHENK